MTKSGVFGYVGLNPKNQHKNSQLATINPLFDAIFATIKSFVTNTVKDSSIRYIHTIGVGNPFVKYY